MDVDKFWFDSIEKDQIHSNENGFHFVSHGRTAVIYFVESSSIVPIEAEMPGVDYLDILVWGEIDHLKRRYFPHNKKTEEIPTSDRLRIQKLLVNWLLEKGLKHDIDVKKMNF